MESPPPAEPQVQTVLFCTCSKFFFSIFGPAKYFSSNHHLIFGENRFFLGRGVEIANSLAWQNFCVWWQQHFISIRPD